MNKPRFDPPLLSRLTWRDPMRAETLISQDRGMMARTYASLYLLAGATGWFLLAFGGGEGRNEAAFVVLSLVAVVLGAACILVYRRVPFWGFELLTAIGTVMVTCAAAASADGAQGLYALFYVWIALLSGLFFRLRYAAIQICLAIAGYALVLYDRDTEFAINYLVALALVLVTAGFTIALLRARIEQLAANLSSQAHTDSLTGLGNRRAFDERYEVESARAVRTGESLSIGICDLDGFKAVNDRLGHQEGDETLKRAAKAIREAVRTIDAVARLGGEEFGVLFPNTGPKEAHRVGERIRRSVRAEFKDGPISLTISCGLATFGRDGEGRGLVRAADLALYQAKANGKDRTVTFEHGADPAQSVEDSSTK